VVINKNSDDVVGDDGIEMMVDMLIVLVVAMMVMTMQDYGNG
jgi:hypothetical protein